MTNYRRARFAGGFYFFTVVVHKRKKLFIKELARNCLRQAIRRTKRHHPYETIALCLLPDHLHCIWQLPVGDADFSIRWSLIKSSFTREYLLCGGFESPISNSRIKKREHGIWQRRFWEHQIRDEADLHRHVDYVHFNPVKHNLVERVEDWPWSTYHNYVKSGLYTKDEWYQRRDELEKVLAGE